MSYEDIKKALEEFQNRILKTNLSYHIFESEMMAVVNALALINRQQAKNNKLELENEVLKDAKNQLENELCNERMNLEHIVAEFERLQKKYDRAMDNLKAVLKERAGEQ